MFALKDKECKTGFFKNPTISIYKRMVFQFGPWSTGDSEEVCGVLPLLYGVVSDSTRFRHNLSVSIRAT